VPCYTELSTRLDAVARLFAAQRIQIRDQALDAVPVSVLPACQSLLASLEAFLSLAPTDIGVCQYPGENALEHRSRPVGGLHDSHAGF